MPADVEEALWREARRRFPGDEDAQRRFVYGTLRSQYGWKPGKGDKPKPKPKKS